MNTIVFLGPTLSISEAKQILPDAMYLPPVRCGDVLRVLRLKPKVIAIIDGYFEHTAAIWHKEILFAIDSGVMVYGASSMGALRAAELTKFGMRGVGKIYHDYVNGVINDDDEVAVLHTTRAKNYLCSSDAMVNIRSTVARAIEENIITDDFGKIILQAAKSLPYQQRNLQNIQNKILPKQNVAKFFAWVNAGNIIDQKKLDAIELLNACKDLLHTETVLQNVQKSVFLRALHNDVMCRPFHIKHELLSAQEKVAVAARIFGDDYRFTRRLSYLWSAVYALAKNKNSQNILDKNSQFIFLNKLEEIEDCDLQEREKFCQRLQLVDNLIATQKEMQPTKFLIALMQTSGDYQTFRENITAKNLAKRQDLILENFAKAQPLRYKILFLSAVCWCAIEDEVGKFNLHPDMQSVENFANQFRGQKKLFTESAMQLWLQANDLDFSGFVELMKIMARMRFLVLQTNLDAINIFQDNEENIWWFLDMLRLTGLYQLAKKTIFDENFKKEIYLKLEGKKQILNNASAYLFDFVEGFEEFLAEKPSF